MRTKEELDRLRERAIALRREGKSRREIKAILGPMSNSTLNEFPPGRAAARLDAPSECEGRTARKARDLRAQGLDYDEIAASLGVSKSSVSLWVRDLPTPPRLSYEENRKRSAEGSRRYWGVERTVREARRAAGRARHGRDRRHDRPRDPHRRGYRLLVRRREEQAAPPRRASGLHQQRSGADRILPEVPRHGRHPARRLDIPRVHTRDRRREAAQRFWLDLTGASPASSGGRCSSSTTRRPCERTSARATAAACGSTSGEAAISTGRIEGWAAAAMLASA